MIHNLELSPLMQFLYPRRPFVYTSIYRRSDCQGPAYYRADTCQEAGKGLGPLFAVDDFHWRDILHALKSAKRLLLEEGSQILT